MSTLAVLRASVSAETRAAIRAAVAREVAGNAPAPSRQDIARIAPPLAGGAESLIPQHTERDGRQHTIAA